MFALFASCSTQYSAALRCAAGQITIDPKARHHTCCFFVDDACRFCLLVAVAVRDVTLGRFVCTWYRFFYRICVGHTFGMATNKTLYRQFRRLYTCR